MQEFSIYMDPVLRLVRLQLEVLFEENSGPEHYRRGLSEMYEILAPDDGQLAPLAQRLDVRASKCPLLNDQTALGQVPQVRYRSSPLIAFLTGLRLWKLHHIKFDDENQSIGPSSLEDSDGGQEDTL